MPRPKKSILLYADDETRRSVLKLMLETHRYIVLGGISSLEPIPRVVLVVDDRSLATCAAACSIWERLPYVAMLVLLAPGHSRLPNGYPSIAQAMPPNCLPIELLARIRIAAIRKRGPKRLERGPAVLNETKGELTA